MTRAGYGRVLQVSCRARNRLAIQGDLLEAKPGFDLDSITLLGTARALRDHGRFLSGRALEAPPAFFLGAVENPFAPPFEERARRLAKKVEAGAEFIQTQFCFD